MVEMDAADAREIVARHLAASAIRDAIDGAFITWSDFPDISKNDWQAVCDRARDLAAPMTATEDRFKAAYAALAARANRDKI